MLKGGYRRKKNSWSFVLTNEDILTMCNTENLCKYIERQQRNFVSHIIRMENANGTKQLLFNNNPSNLPGRENTLYSAVMKNENVTADVLNNKAMTRQY